MLYEREQRNSCPNHWCLSLKVSYVVSLLFVLLSLGAMLHVNFKKRPCRCVEFKGEEPVSTAPILMPFKLLTSPYVISMDLLHATEYSHMAFLLLLLKVQCLIRFLFLSITFFLFNFSIHFPSVKVTETSLECVDEGGGGGTLVLNGCCQTAAYSGSN